MKYKKNSLLILSLFISTFFFACSYFKKPSVSFNINAPELSGIAGTLYTSFQAVQIPVLITNSEGFSLRTTLNAGSNALELPVGNLNIKIGYLALGSTSATHPICGEESDGPENVLYSEFQSDFSINANTSSININFPEPFAVIPMERFGFQIKDANGNPAANASITYYDIISEKILIDPCKGSEINEIADSLGRIATDFPVYSNTFKLRFVIKTPDGNSKLFESTFTRGNATAQFYFLNMNSGSVVPMNESTDSFLQDGYSIAYTRNTLLKNPRFPDFSSYILQSPNMANYSVNLGPQINDPNPYSLIRSRRIKIYCEIKDSTNTNILLANQICPRSDFIITSLPITWTLGQLYNIYAYAVDSDGYHINPTYPSVTFSYYPN